jgi:hypothetical protein
MVLSLRQPIWRPKSPDKSSDKKFLHFDISWSFWLANLLELTTPFFNQKGRKGLNSKKFLVDTTTHHLNTAGAQMTKACVPNL